MKSSKENSFSLVQGPHKMSALIFPSPIKNQSQSPATDLVKTEMCRTGVVGGPRTLGQIRLGRVVCCPRKRTCKDFFLMRHKGL